MKWNKKCDKKMCDEKSGVSMIGDWSPALKVDGKVFEPLGCEKVYVNKTNRLKYIFDFGLSIIQEIKTLDKDRLLKTYLVNEGRQDVAIDEIMPMYKTCIYGKFEKGYVSSKNLVGPVGIFELDEKLFSYSLAGITDDFGKSSCLLGFVDLRRAIYTFSFERTTSDVVEMTAVCEREGIVLEQGNQVEVSPLFISCGSSLSKQLDDYGVLVAEIMKPNIKKEIKTGWCSWYYYYSNESVTDIRSNMESLKNSPIGNEIKVIQIDDGWNLPYNGHARVWGDWEPGEKFPEGMKAVADLIHEYGFEAGLWLAPFSVDGSSKLAKEHPDWLLRGDDGLNAPLSEQGIYGLDLTNDHVLAFLRQTFIKVFDEWGFDYIKIDFLEHGLMKGQRKDPTKTSAEAYRMGLEVIEEVKKDRFSLYCGAPIGQAVGMCDAMRIGCDTGSRWYVPMNLPAWPYGNCSIVSAAYSVIHRQWMHRVWWQNDPDCIVVRQDGNVFERDMFASMGPSADLKVSDFGLAYEEAAFFVRLVWFTGSMTLLSDNWQAMTEERRDLVKRMFPMNEEEVYVVDYYEDIHFSIMATRSNRLKIGLFNMSDHSKSLELESDRFGINNWCFKEWLSGEIFEGQGDRISFPVLEARQARIWELMEV